MRGALLAILVGLLVVGCTASAPGGAATDDGTGPGIGESPGAVDPGGGSGTGSAGLPSGAQVQIFNAYSDPVGTPVALDVYAAPWVLEGETPLLTVEYGTLSPPFDPTVVDEAGNMFLSMYAEGESGNGNSVFSGTQTLSGTEVITYLVGRGTGVMANGRAGSISESWFDPNGGGAEGQAPAPGKGRVGISTVGLDTTLADSDVSWFPSFGSGCARSVLDTDEFSMALIAPGSGATYELDPGTYTLTLHDFAADADCSGPSVLGDIEVVVEADRASVVYLYAPTPDDLRSVVVPLSVP